MSSKVKQLITSTKTHKTKVETGVKHYCLDSKLLSSPIAKHSSIANPLILSNSYGFKQKIPSTGLSKTLIHSHKKINPYAKGYHYLGGKINCYSCHKKLYLPQCQICLEYYAKNETKSVDHFEKIMGNSFDDVEYPNLICPGNHSYNELYLMCTNCELYYSISPCCSNLNLLKILDDKRTFKKVVQILEEGKYKIQLSKFVGFNTPQLLKLHYVTCQIDNHTHCKNYCFPEFRPNKMEQSSSQDFIDTNEYLRFYQDVDKLNRKSISYQHLPRNMFDKYINETIYYHYLTYYHGDKEQLYTNLKSYFCQGKYKFNDLWKSDNFETEMHWTCQRCNAFYHQILSREIIEKIDCSPCLQIKTLRQFDNGNTNETTYHTCQK